jgi:hypothetical protein
VCAYGESRRDVAAKSDPPRRFVRENIAALIDRRGRFEYLALYTRLSSPLVRPKPGKFSAVPRVGQQALPAPAQAGVWPENSRDGVAPWVGGLKAPEAALEAVRAA